MTRVSRRLLFTAAVLFAVGCSEDVLSISQGANSALSVRAYVDGDGDGAFGAATDVGIDAATVTATSSTDGATVEGTTDATGLAQLDLPPGSYQLALTGTIPTGAVLATAQNPTVVAPFEGATLSSEYRFSYLPGDVVGVLFRDDDADSTYTAGSDTPAAGIVLRVFAGSDTTATPEATTATDAGGAYRFEDLRPGDHTIVITPFPTMTIVGDVSQAIVIDADQETDFDILFTGSVLLSGAEVRNAASGDLVAMEGVVTWQPGFDTRNYFLQDGTAGIAVFDFDRVAGDLAVGDSIRIVGTRGAFNGEVQIASPTSVELLGNVGEPAVRTVTAAQINGGQYQGELVTISANVDSVIVLSFDNQSVFLTDVAGQEFLVYSDSRTGVLPANWTAGRTFSVTGVIGNDDRNTPAPRIEVRSPDDVVEGVSTIPIADARQLVGDTVTVEGVVTWQTPFETRVYFFQDSSGGISTFDISRPTLAIGDRIRVVGVVAAFRGEIQLSPVIEVTVVAQETPPLPRIVTGAQINAGSFQGELVRITGSVLTVDTLSFDNQLVTLDDGTGTLFTVYADSRTGVLPAAWPAVDQNIDVIGVLGTDDRNTLGPRIEVRDTTDLLMTVSTVSIAAARSMNVGDVVTVQGVVTEQNSWDSRIYFFQDATGGISVFDANNPTLVEGQVIQATGPLGAFRGEIQLASVTQLTIIGIQTVPEPRSVTGAEINAGSFQGELVRIIGSVSAIDTLSFDNQLVTLDDGTGTLFTVYADSRSGVLPGFWPDVGDAITVTGVLGTDDRNTPAPRVEVRRVEDLTVSIVQARAATAGETGAVIGTVTWSTEWDNRIYFFQDGTGGISTFDGSDPTLARGDRIYVFGTIGAFRGEIQVGSISRLIVLSQEDIPPPRAVTATQINAGQFQGELVTITATVSAIDTLSFDNQLVTLDDGTGALFSVYADSRTGVLPAAWPAAGGSVTVTGVLATDDRNTPAPRIEVRDTFDVR